MTNQQILLHITGPDYPGSLSKILKAIEQLEAKFVDVQQTTTLGQLSLSLLLETSVEKGILLIKETTNVVRELKLNISFHILDSKEYKSVSQRRHMVLTMLAESIPLSAFQAVSEITGQLQINIERMTRLAGDSLDCLEFYLALPDDEASFISAFREKLLDLAQQMSVDFSLQKENIYRRSKRLIVLDMDSTLIQQEVIDEIADFGGIKEQVAEITERAMRGEIDFKESLTERVKLLKDIPLESLDKVLDRIELTPGAENLIRSLKKMGYKIAIISGGFSFFTRYFCEKYSLDSHHSNTLEVENGKLTGRVQGDIVDREAKAEILKELAKREQIPLDQTVAVGDGANDLDMLAAAGLGIAFNAKPTVRSQTSAYLNRPRLDFILYLLGVPQVELDELENL